MGSNMNLITLENRPTEPALAAPWMSLNPNREWMNFSHPLHNGTTKAISLEQNQSALFKLAHYRIFDFPKIARCNLGGTGGMATPANPRAAFAARGDGP
jgi:hypothetical protein